MHKKSDAPAAAPTETVDDTQAPQCPDFAEIVRNSDVDESLFEQVASCFSKRLADFANYYCNDFALGQDAFQEAMITTWKQLGTYRGDSPIEPWLRRIVVSSCSRLRRGKKNNRSLHTPLDDHPMLPELSDHGPSAEMRTMIAQGMERVSAEIDRLNEPNRSLLLRHDVYEESVAALAGEFQMTVDAVKSRLKRSRAQVRSAILEAPLV
ncbi:MAG: sigma-70 family RNA polymerase sigma factor [Proteobacteria bacterium]|nr:sigma-70 family RNA polymerase sigma factor [Pseudomonadota bacterium]